VKLKYISKTKKEYLRAKIKELETNSKIKNISKGASMTLRRATNLELI